MSLIELFAADPRQREITTSFDFQARAWHRALVIILFIGLSLETIIVGSLDLNTLPFVAATLILALGAPHGAFDIAIIRRRCQDSIQPPLSIVLARYIGLVGLVLAIWYLAPGLSLAAFLIVSAYHFGGDWAAPHQRLQRMILGGAMLCATTLRHQTNVAQIFQLLSSERSGQDLAALMQGLAAPLLGAAAVIILARSIINQPAQSLEIAAVLLAASLLPPITFFVIYFCLLHSVRHLLAVGQELAGTNARTQIVAALPYAVAATGGTALAALVLGHTSYGQDLLSAAFVAMAALTVPHMLLVDAE